MLNALEHGIVKLECRLLAKQGRRNCISREAIMDSFIGRFVTTAGISVIVISELMAGSKTAMPLTTKFTDVVSSSVTSTVSRVLKTASNSLQDFLLTGPQRDCGELLRSQALSRATWVVNGDERLKVRSRPNTLTMPDLGGFVVTYLNPGDFITETVEVEGMNPNIDHDTAKWFCLKKNNIPGYVLRQNLEIVPSNIK